MVLIGDLLIDLIELSERAAEIARLIRANDELFKLLIEVKDESSKNQRFVVDFKTLADVLIQQTIKYHLTRKYPKIDGNSIRGEESNVFTNSQGVTIEIDLNGDLAGLLSEVLVDHADAVKLLCEIIYREPTSTCTPLSRRLFEIDLEDEEVFLWIDPIDCTNEYVKSQSPTDRSHSSFPLNGLHCVTCLIGVFSRQHGEAIMGVINLPFFTYDQENKCYTGKYVWGVDYKKIGHEICLNNIELSEIQSNLNDSKDAHKLKIALSSSEREKVIDELKDELIFVTGQGYKLYLVITGQVDLFLTTKPTTFKWDTCAASAILSSIKSIKCNSTKSDLSQELANDEPAQKIVRLAKKTDDACKSEKEGNLLELMSLAKDYRVNSKISLSNYELKYNMDDLVNKNGLIASLDPNLIHQMLNRLNNLLFDESSCISQKYSN